MPGAKSERDHQKVPCRASTATLRTPMSPDLDPISDLSLLVEEVERASRERPEVRSALRRLVAWLTDLVADPPVAAPPPAVVPMAPLQEATLPLVLGAARAQVRVSAPSKDIETVRAAVESRSRKVESPVPAPVAEPLDLSVVVARCKLKAE